MGRVERLGLAVWSTAQYHRLVVALAGDNEDRPEVATLLEVLEDAIEKLRIDYERYFLGVEKAAPVRERGQVQKRLRELERLHVRSTVHRFRLAGLRARLVTYQHYWTRVEHEMERGVSRRDRLRNRRAPTPAPESAATPTPASSRPADLHALGLDAENVKSVYRALVAAKRSAGESTEGLTYSALVRKLTREAPRLRARHACEKIHFEIDVDGGKVRLRGRPA